MDVLHIILNILLPPLTIIFLFLFLFYPIYLFIKLLNCVRKHLCVENVAGKVVLITGASSGIGEHVAYEYAKKGADLALVARREDRLQIVAETSRKLGSRDVIIIPGDVTKINDCMKFISETISHFGKVDHLINNAGVSQTVLFENFSQIQDANPIMDTNFWGSTYITYYAIPHLRKSKGKIVVIASAAAKIAIPVATIYSGSDFIVSEPVSRCAKAIFQGVCRGEEYVETPSWIKWFFLVKSVCPEVINSIFNYFFLHFTKPYFKRE
ncbi:hypothetical protein HID58_077697 [Brassica napus]|uniref:3-oxoacyl-[acyl-carrier-protein] reductase n=1 Tax=Brassica napus TaxID=3708 RepID=A0ABQ7YTH8_BRANA|nr:hypothetical protein HID58_077697 [Brassica napus]